MAVAKDGFVKCMGNSAEPASAACTAHFALSRLDTHACQVGRRHILPQMSVPSSPKERGAWSFLMPPFFRRARSEVGESDETNVLDSAKLGLLASALEGMACPGRADIHLWPFDWSTFCQPLGETSLCFGISLVSCTMRRSGVTIDRASRTKSQEEA